MIGRSTIGQRARGDCLESGHCPNSWPPANTTAFIDPIPFPRGPPAFLQAPAATTLFTAPSPPGSWCFDEPWPAKAFPKSHLAGPDTQGPPEGSIFSNSKTRSPAPSLSPTTRKPKHLCAAPQRYFRLTGSQENRIPVVLFGAHEAHLREKHEFRAALAGFTYFYEPNRTGRHRLSRPAPRGCARSDCEPRAFGLPVQIHRPFMQHSATPTPKRLRRL